MKIKSSSQLPRIYVLDTNVLMHDPASLFRFEEHDVFIPMTVLEELDAAKKGLSEVSRNVRQASRFINGLMEKENSKSLLQGLKLEQPLSISIDRNKPQGKLFFETGTEIFTKSTKSADNLILESALRLRDKNTQKSIIIVSKDINLRIKANVIGLQAEDYFNDHVLDDLSLLYSGETLLPADFWERQQTLDSWTENGSTFYKVKGPDLCHLAPNQCVYVDAKNSLEAIICDQHKDVMTLRIVADYRKKSNIWGLNARNREQNFALNLLLDPDIDFVSLLGNAGTGKTLLSLAAGLAQTLDTKRYREIIVTRATVPVGDDIGFLPGTEEEKMTPWMGALSDNLEVLAPTHGGGDWGRAATQELLTNKIKIRSLNFMRGRTFLNRFVIIDEAQNLTPKQMKTLLTRAGPGTKMVCLGNIQQIDTPYITETSSGLTYAVDRFSKWEHSGHITLLTGERSRLADFASEAL